MKTLAQLVDELGLTPTSNEIYTGQTGKYVVVYPDKTYMTLETPYLLDFHRIFWGCIIYEVLYKENRQ